MRHAVRSHFRWLPPIVLAFVLSCSVAVGPARVHASDLVMQVVDDRCSDPDPTIAANGKLAVLDPGHHWGDPGASNATFGLREADLTLNIAERTRRALNSLGYRVCLTRTATVDERMGNSDRGNYANTVAQGYPTSKTVFLSIHLNATASQTDKTNYTKTFWGKKNKDLAFSRAIHDALWDELRVAVNADGTSVVTNLTDGGVGQFATGSLLHASMAGTLAETVFLSNNAEAERLVPDCPDTGQCRRQQIAGRLAAGVDTWLRAR